MAEFAYVCFKFLVSILVGVFYRHIEVRGSENIPGEGSPVIFAGTHPNALVDPAIILVYSSRTIRLAAKDQLFRLPVLGQIMRAIGVVPVRRAQDHEGQRQDNSAMFEAMWSILAKGDAVAIFPEGTTVFEPKMRPLKTGAGRIAVAFSARYKKPIPIVPVSLTYMNRNRFRTNVLVEFGPPLMVESTETDVEKQFEQAKVITSSLQQTLESMTINAPDWATLKLIETARSIYTPDDVVLSPVDHIKLMQRFITGYMTASQKDATGVESLRREIENYRLKLEALGLSDNDVKPHSKTKLNTDKGSIILNLLLWPLAIVGTVINGPIAVLSQFTAKILARGEIVEEATYTLMSALIFCLLFYTLIPGIFAYYFGMNVGLLALIAGLVTGYAAVTVRPFTNSILFLQSKTRIAPKDLKDEREALRLKLLAAVDKLADPNLPRMFYGGKPNN